MIADELASIAQEPRFNCLYRHMLESMLRVSSHAPQHVLHAAERGLPSTIPLSWNFLKSHIWSLAQSVSIDQAAAPVQAKGIVIVCGDIPPIPPN